ncbi:MAG: ABC transporter permease [Rhizomicrobium sp.]|nr:ABC transporter permease [Rhizomicrobium sp.]
MSDADSNTDEAWPSQTSFAEGLTLQLRVIGALILREIHTRYARENIGFLWVVAEPMLFAGGVIAMRTILPFFPREQHGMSLIGFLMTGYLPFLVYRHMIGRCIHCVRANQSVLYHRQVRIIDLYLTQLVLEGAGTVVAFAFGASVFVAFGLMDTPKNLFLLYTGWFYAIWFCGSLAMLLGAASELSSLVDKLYNPLSYLSLPLSGAFYMVNWLPHAWQDYALYIPMVHFFEMIRGGYFGEALTVHYDTAYITGVCLVLTFGALQMVTIARKRVAIA